MKRWIITGIVIALAMLTAMPVMADRGGGQGGNEDRAGQQEARGGPERNQAETHDADAPNGDQDHSRDRDRDNEGDQDQNRERDGEDAQEQVRTRNGDGDAEAALTQARVRTEMRAGFEVQGEIVAFDPATRRLMLRIRIVGNPDAGETEMVQVQAMNGALYQQRVGTAWESVGPAALKVGQVVAVRGTIHDETWTASRIRLGLSR